MIEGHQIKMHEEKNIVHKIDEYRDRINDIRRLQSLTLNEAYLVTPGGFKKFVTFERLYFSR